MDDKKTTVSHALKQHLRAIRLLHHICPGYFPILSLYCLTAALTPYATVYCSARILSELAGPRRAEALWTWVAVTVAVIGLLQILKALWGQRKDTLLDDLFDRKDILFVQKMFSMDYASLEDRETQDLRAQIQQNESWSGWGLMRTPQIFEEGVQAVIGICSGIVLTVPLFLQPVPDAAGWLTCLNSPFYVFLLAAVLLGISALGGRWESRVLHSWSSVREEATFGNRLFGFFGFIGLRSERAGDMRIYDQQRLVDAYWHGNSVFGCEGPIAAAMAKGKAGMYAGLSQAIFAVLTGLIYVFVCLKAWGGAFDIGAVTQYVGAVTALAMNVYGVWARVGEMKTNAGYLEQTFTFLDLPNGMYQGSLTTEKRSDRQYAVEFRHVSFRYPGSENWALRDVSLKFEIGKRLAIVGQNGSGKTTFIKLLCRLYDPQEGQILLNGIDIRKYNYQDCMQIFSVVFQDFQLLSQSLGSNVAGAMEYDRARVRKALEDAGFGDRLRTMPQGLDTQLYRDYGENGVEVSGGEAQKIAIARALYKDAPFIILDEPTAALDPIAEADIYSRFNDIAGDRTAIYISHRLSSCKFCDEIVVFDQGHIVQRGSHEALLHDETGLYRQLWDAQAQYYVNQ